MSHPVPTMDYDEEVPVCRFGHDCTSSCGNDKECPCQADHCCARTDCDGCDDHYEKVEVVSGIDQLFTDPIARKNFLEAIDQGLTNYQEDMVDDAKEDGFRSQYPTHV